MDWKQKAKEFYHKVAHGVMRYVAPVLMMLPSAGAARSNVKADKDEVFLKQKNSEATVTNDVSENAELTHPLIYNPEIYQDINCLDMEKVAEKISQMTLGEILQKGLISQEQLQAYQFSTEDFEQMEQGDLGDKLESFLQKKCKGNPQGDCLTGVRQGAANAWGVNVWTPSGLAKDWPESVAKSNMPVAFLGKVIVKEGKDGKLEDQGNIKLKDLLSLPGAIVVIDGNRQPAGHVSYVKRKKDKTGKRVATISLCDGRENYETVVNKKIGGGKRRYGNIVTVMIPKDVTISKGLAEYIMTKVLERTSNAVELCAMINPQEDILQECLKMPYEPNFSKFSRDYVLAQLDRVRKKEQEHNKKVEPAEKTLAQAPQDKNGKTGTKSLASRQFERS